MTSKFLAILGVSVIIAGGAFAQHKKAAPAGPTCPICHMPLSSKATKADPTAVRLTKKGKVLYCCPKCPMPASMLVKKKK